MRRAVFTLLRHAIIFIAAAFQFSLSKAGPLLSRTSVSSKATLVIYAYYYAFLRRDCRYMPPKPQSSFERASAGRVIIRYGPIRAYHTRAHAMAL